MMGAVLGFAQRLYPTTCEMCGVEFAMPEHMLNQRRESKEAFFCPNGHSLSFTESTVQRLEKQLVAARAETDIQRRARADAEHARDLNAAARTKAEKKLARAKNGVCPCCKRSFTALRRHMASKHPEWKP